MYIVKRFLLLSINEINIFYFRNNFIGISINTIFIRKSIDFIVKEANE